MSIESKLQNIFYNTNICYVHLKYITPKFLDKLFKYTKRLPYNTNKIMYGFYYNHKLNGYESYVENMDKPYCLYIITSTKRIGEGYHFAYKTTCIGIKNVYIIYPFLNKENEENENCECCNKTNSSKFCGTCGLIICDNCTKSKLLIAMQDKRDKRNKNVNNVNVNNVIIKLCDICRLDTQFTHEFFKFNNLLHCDNEKNISVDFDIDAVETCPPTYRIIFIDKISIAQSVDYFENYINEIKNELIETRIEIQNNINEISEYIKSFKIRNNGIVKTLVLTFESAATDISIIYPTETKIKNVPLSCEITI